MADRTSAEIFSEVLTISSDHYLSPKQRVREVYELMQHYDFSEEQLSDDAREILKVYGIWEPEED